MRDLLGRFKKGNNPWIKGKVLSNSYLALHHWSTRNIVLGKECKICGRQNCKLEQANIDHSYKRNPDDWVTLCVSCHRTHDFLNNDSYKKWLKSRKGKSNE